MNRRTFFGRLGVALAGAAIATHMELGRLVPVLGEEIVDDDYFININATDPSFSMWVKGIHTDEWIKMGEIVDGSLKIDMKNLPSPYRPAEVKIEQEPMDEGMK
jgi:hypothetical protein